MSEEVLELYCIPLHGECNRLSLCFSESPTLKVDERLRLARERREEHLKQLGTYLQNHVSDILGFLPV